MPWIGLSDGERITPEQVSNSQRVTCPDCGGDMYPRGPTVDGKARHFTHTSGGSSANQTCNHGGGESEVHRRMKSQVVSALKQWFSDHIRMVTLEANIDVSESASPLETRNADIHVVFTPPHPVFGSDLVVEVQHRNYTKPVESVTHDYIVAGYSVYWAAEHTFATDRFLIGELITAFNRDDTPTYSEADGTVPAAVVASVASPLDFDPLPPGESDTDCTDVLHDNPQDSASAQEEGTSSNITSHGNETEPVAQGETKPTTIPSTDPAEKYDDTEYQLSDTAPAEGFKVETHRHEKYPDIGFVVPSEEVGWYYAGVPPHPPASIIDDIPRTTPSGHPIPHVPDCEHSFYDQSQLNSAMATPTECQKCGLTVYKKPTADITPQHDVWGLNIPYRYYIARPYRSLPTPALYFDGDNVNGDLDGDGRDFAPYCGDRIWLVDFDSDEYWCTTCGRRFPRNNNALRDQYGDSTDNDGSPQS